MILKIETFGYSEENSNSEESNRGLISIDSMEPFDTSGMFQLGYNADKSYCDVADIDT